MSRTRSSRKREGDTLGSGAQAARRTAAQVRPLAKSTGATAARGVHKTRAWAAPQVERAGQVLQDSVAPRVSALLSSAARRLEPEGPSRQRWRKLVRGSALTAAAGAVAALVRRRMKPDPDTSPDQPDAGDVTPAPQARNGQARTSTDGQTADEAPTAKQKTRSS